MAISYPVNKVKFGDTVLIDISQDTVVSNAVLNGYTFHDKNGTSATGSIATATPVSGSITTKAQTVTIPAGYYTTSGSVAIASAEQNKLIASNIAKGVTVLGVTGAFTSDANATADKILSGYSAYVNGVKITGTADDWVDDGVVG